MPIRLCLERGCRNPAAYRGRCRECSPIRERATHLNKAFYNSAKWRHTREYVLSRQPLCSCGAIATDVDHIRPIEAGGEPWAKRNLQPLCRSCHGQKTRREQATR